MSINYNELTEITVHNQQELDDIPTDFKGRIYIECTATVRVSNRYYRSVVARGNSSVEAWGNSSVKAWGNSSVKAWENSSVEARDNSLVEARDNSLVEAWENSSVKAWGKSSVVARDNSSVVARDNSSVEAREDSSVVARKKSSVEARDNSSVEARENSSVVARDNSLVEARDNSLVEARDNSSVVARKKSSVEARDNSSVVARKKSSVVARDNSSVVAKEKSSVEAWGNSQVVNRLVNGKIKLNGNAREVFMPKTIHEFMDFYGIKHTETKATFYKAVRKTEDGIFYADYNSDFTYEIGEYKSEPNIDTDVTEECGSGINIAHLAWALDFGRDWDNLAIIEVETEIADIILPEDSTGKVRTSKVKVIREVPLEECGIMGKIIARKHSTRA